MLLVRISSSHAVAAATSLSFAKSKLLRAVESAPDGFVVTDADGTVLAANAAFVLASPDDRRGQAYAIANGGMNLGQGLLYVLAGAAASTPAVTIATGATLRLDVANALGSSVAVVEAGV